MNKDKRNNIQLLGTLNNADESGIIANANQVYDANEDKSTQDVSKEHKERIETLETKENSMQTTLENISKTGEASAASNVTYNHNDSQLDATNVQQAIDEVRKKSNYNDGENIIDFNTIHLITDNPEYICVAVDADEKILYGIKTDGQPYFGVGCPQQVKDYIDEQINKILGTNDITTTIDSLKEIETFLKDFTNSDTLKALLDTKANKVDVVFDISAYHATGGTLATYDNLEDALGTNGKNIPQSLRKGGMSVKFVQTSDNKYVQARLMANSFTTDVTQWQGVDEVPTARSNNLIKSGGVKDEFDKVKGIHELISGDYDVTANFQNIVEISRYFEGIGTLIFKFWSENGAKMQLTGVVHKSNGDDYSSYPFAELTDQTISEETSSVIKFPCSQGLSYFTFQSRNKTANGTVKYKISIEKNGITDNIDLKIKNLSKDVLIFNDSVTPSYKPVVNVNVDIPKNIGITIEATSDTASGALLAAYKFDDDSEVYFPQVPIVAGSTTKTVFDNAKPLKQILLSSNNSITASGNLIIKIRENLDERISDNTNSINDIAEEIDGIAEEIDGIAEEIDGIADVVKTGNVAVVQSQYKSVINLTDVVTSENVPLIIKVWSEDGAAGVLNGAIADFSGDFHQNWPSIYITDQNITEATAAYLEYPIPNGVSKIQFNAQSGNITASGTIKWKVVLKGLKSIAENNVINLGRELFPTIINAENYLKKARRKFVVWIDDDGEPNGLAKVNTICQAKNIRCTMAVVTNRFSETFGQQTRLDVYKNYQSMGYDIVSHSHTHGRYWYSGDAAYNINSIREDVVNTYKAMIENGFTAKCLVYPGGGGYDFPARREVSQYFQFAFVAGYNLPTTPCKGNRYCIDRFFMQAQSDPNKTDFIAYVNACENSGRMPILASHSAVESWNTEWDDTYMAECIQYMIDEGYTFVTSSQAMEITRGMYDLLDMFNASV